MGWVGCAQAQRVARGDPRSPCAWHSLIGGPAPPPTRWPPAPRREHVPWPPPCIALSCQVLRRRVQPYPAEPDPPAPRPSAAPPSLAPAASTHACRAANPHCLILILIRIFNLILISIVIPIFTPIFPYVAQRRPACHGPPAARSRSSPLNPVMRPRDPSALRRAARANASLSLCCSCDATFSTRSLPNPMTIRGAPALLAASRPAA